MIKWVKLIWLIWLIRTQITRTDRPSLKKRIVRARYYQALCDAKPGLEKFILIRAGGSYGKSLAKNLDRKGDQA